MTFDPWAEQFAIGGTLKKRSAPPDMPTPPPSRPPHPPRPVPGREPPAFEPPIQRSEWNAIRVSWIGRIAVATGAGLALGLLAVAVARAIASEDTSRSAMIVSGIVTLALTGFLTLSLPIWSPAWWTRRALQNAYSREATAPIEALRRIDSQIAGHRAQVAAAQARIAQIESERLQERSMLASDALEQMREAALRKCEIEAGCCDRVGPQTVANLRGAGIRSAHDVLAAGSLTHVFGVGGAIESKLIQWASAADDRFHPDRAALDAFIAKRGREIDYAAAHRTAEQRAAIAELNRHAPPLAAAHSAAMRTLSDLRGKYRAKLREAASASG
jgi:hypothetical protein